MDVSISCTERFVDDVKFFFLNHTATTVIYTLSLHDALPILYQAAKGMRIWLVLAKNQLWLVQRGIAAEFRAVKDRKSTRLNSSHTVISYAVFCLKKKTSSSDLLCKRGLADNARHPGEAAPHQ